MFDLERIAAAGLVARIDYHQSLPSTSDRALSLGAEGETDLPLLVLTEQQTAGRGRGTNRWSSREGALTFSLLLDAPLDKLPAQRWPQVALTAGVAVADALQSLAPLAPVQLKWPNDLFINARKAGGILSESVPGLRDRLVVGMGINVNNRESASLAAAALIEMDGRARDLTDVLIAILDEFDRRWRQLLVGDFAAIATAYRQRCLLTGKYVTLEQTGGRPLAGLCRGIDGSGALLLATSQGEQSVYSAAALTWE